MAWRRLGKGGPATTTLPSFLPASLKRAHCSASALNTEAAGGPLAPGFGAAGADVCPPALAGLDTPAGLDPQAAAAIVTTMRTPNHLAFTLAPPARCGNRHPFYWTSRSCTSMSRR